MPAKKVLLFHVFIVNNWLFVCNNILKNVPHDDIFIHICYKSRFSLNFWISKIYFSRIRKIKQIFYSKNNLFPETTALEMFRKNIDFKNYSILTYVHAKGVTKKNKNIRDWVELMRYFIMDKMDLCLSSFEMGYKLYGTNLNIYNEKNKRYGPFVHSEFHFSGNFISLNLTYLYNEFISTPIPKDYFGVEGFWGLLCKMSEIYCPYSAPLDLYHNPYPEHLYKNIGNFKIPPKFKME